IHDHACDTARVRLLAVFAQDAGEFVDVPRIDDIGGRYIAALRIETHIKRAVAHKGKATLGPVELHGRDAEIEQNRVDALAPAMRVCKLTHAGIAGMDERRLSVL